MGSILTKVGGVGWILVLVYALVLFIATLTNQGLGTANAGLSIMFTISVILGMVGFLLAGLGDFGIGRQVGHSLPLVGGIFGLITAIIGLVGYMIYLVGIVEGAWVLLLGITLLAGLFLLLSGISFVVGSTKTQLPMPALVISSGIVSLIAGILFLLSTLALIGIATLSVGLLEAGRWMLLIGLAVLMPASILNMIVSFKA